MEASAFPPLPGLETKAIVPHSMSDTSSTDSISQSQSQSRLSDVVKGTVKSKIILKETINKPPSNAVTQTSDTASIVSLADPPIGSIQSQQYLHYQHQQLSPQVTNHNGRSTSPGPMTSSVMGPIINSPNIQHLSSHNQLHHHHNKISTERINERQQQQPLSRSICKSSNHSSNISSSTNNSNNISSTVDVASSPAIVSSSNHISTSLSSSSALNTPTSANVTETVVSIAPAVDVVSGTLAIVTVAVSSSNNCVQEGQVALGTVTLTPPTSPEK